MVPARNEERSIGACLDSILAQDHLDLQVIVVDGASADETARIVREYAARDHRIELLSNPRSTIPSSLNVGLKAARGRWLVRVDAHSTIPPGYVGRAVEHLRTGAWGGVGGRKVGVGTTPAGRAIAAAAASRFGAGNSTYHYGTSMQPVEHVPFGAYPTDLVRGLGGWNERVLVNEDFEFDFRVRSNGHRLLFDPELEIEWRTRETLADLFRQYRRYGRGKAAVVRVHPSSLMLRQLAAPALVGALAAALLLAFRRPHLALAAVAPYLAALTVASILTADRLGDSASRRRVPAAFAAMHVAWGIGFWEGMLGRPAEADLAPREAAPGR